MDCTGQICRVKIAPCLTRACMERAMERADGCFSELDSVVCFLLLMLPVMLPMLSMLSMQCTECHPVWEN